MRVSELKEKIKTLDVRQIDDGISLRDDFYQRLIADIEELDERQRSLDERVKRLEGKNDIIDSFGKDINPSACAGG
jgi:FtsZ-binding cell division protein ZapB